MTVAAWLWASAEQGGGLSKAGVDVATAIIGSFVALVGAYVGWTQVNIARKSKTSGDEKVARELIHAARRDTLADRDAWIETLTEERDQARSERQRAETERDEALARVADFRRQELEQQLALLAHVPWDFKAEQAHPELGTPPPLRPIPTPKQEG